MSVPAINGSVSSGTTGDESQSSFTISHTVADSLTNDVLIVFYVADNGGNATAATWNGVAMTKGDWTSAGFGWHGQYFWLANPDTGTHDVVVSFPPN